MVPEHPEKGIQRENAVWKESWKGTIDDRG